MTVVAPAVSVAHVGTLLADVDVIERPLILLPVVVLDPAEPRGTGPAGQRVHKHKDTDRQLLLLLSLTGRLLFLFW